MVKPKKEAVLPLRVFSDDTMNAFIQSKYLPKLEKGEVSSTLAVLRPT